MPYTALTVLIVFDKLVGCACFKITPQTLTSNTWSTIGQFTVGFTVVAASPSIRIVLINFTILTTVGLLDCSSVEGSWTTMNSSILQSVHML